MIKVLIGVEYDEEGDVEMSLRDALGETDNATLEKPDEEFTAEDIVADLKKTFRAVSECVFDMDLRSRPIGVTVAVVNTETHRTTYATWKETDHG